MKICKTCRFAFPIENADGMLQCRRNPPGLFMVQIQGQNRFNPQQAVPVAVPDMFPPVSPSSYCGEWSPALEA